jgi:hypothetical protein
MVSVGGTNGQDRSRLDRIEEILERHSTTMVNIDKTLERHSTFMVNMETLIERQERANEAAHARFEEEDKRLLTAQILMNGAMQDMWRGMTSLELKMEETTGKLNALIATVDGIIRRPPDPNLPATAH